MSAHDSVNILLVDDHKLLSYERSAPRVQARAVDYITVPVAPHYYVGPGSWRAKVAKVKSSRWRTLGITRDPDWIE